MEWEWIFLFSIVAYSRRFEVATHSLRSGGVPPAIRTSSNPSASPACDPVCAIHHRQRTLLEPNVSAPSNCDHCPALVRVDRSGGCGTVVCSLDSRTTGHNSRVFDGGEREDGMMERAKLMSICYYMDDEILYPVRARIPFSRCLLSIQDIESTGSDKKRTNSAIRFPLPRKSIIAIADTRNAKVII